jgi:hypothetical protein
VVGGDGQIETEQFNDQAGLAAMTSDPQNTRRTDRLAYAQSLTEFEDQRAWYSKQSADAKGRAQRIDIVIILLGALVVGVPALKSFYEPTWIDLAVSLLGGAIVVGQGVQRIFRFGEAWPDYRRASERMKSEQRKFINAVPPYDGGEEDARIAYVEALEAAIAEEQKLFFTGAKTKRTQ